MSTQDKYSLKRHLLEDTSKSNPNDEFIEGLKLGGTDGYWSHNGVKKSAVHWMETHSFSYEATPECILGVELHAVYDDVIYIQQLIGYWGPNTDYDPECDGKGYGTQCMTSLIDAADELDIQLTLEPYAFATNEKRPNTMELEQWYMRLGFKHSPQDNGTLVYNYQG